MGFLHSSSRHPPPHSATWIFRQIFYHYPLCITYMKKPTNCIRCQGFTSKVIILRWSSWALVSKLLSLGSVRFYSAAFYWSEYFKCLAMFTPRLWVVAHRTSIKFGPPSIIFYCSKHTHRKSVLGKIKVIYIKVLDIN